MSIFSDVEQAAPVKVFALTQEYNEDPHPNKVNVTIGGKLVCLAVCYLHNIEQNMTILNAIQSTNLKAVIECLV